MAQKNSDTTSTQNQKKEPSFFDKVFSHIRWRKNGGSDLTVISKRGDKISFKSWERPKEEED